MKNILSFLLPFAILISGCSQEELKNGKLDLQDGRIFTASFEQDQTRTYVEDGYLRWTAGDQISLFDGNTLNRQYKFDGETGDNSGTFSIVNAPYGSGNDLTANYAVYPYASSTKIAESGAMTVTLPSEQAYAEDSFGPGANTMVAVTKDKADTFLKFKNVCGYLKLQLYGDEVTVKSITLTGNNNEKIAGAATITPSYSGDPTTSTAEDATGTITLNCEEGVKIGTTLETATAFWIVVPPITFDDGFKVTITDINGVAFTKSTSNIIVVERNIIKPMTAFEVEIEETENGEETIPNNQIWYTSSDGNIITPLTTNEYAGDFGASIVSNTYENGKGIITFDGTITRIGERTFYEKWTLTDITIPKSVATIGDAAFSGCDNLSNVIIPENVTAIGDNTFFGCEKLTTVTIGDRVNSIGKNAFYHCESLSTIVIPNSVTTIGSQAFYGCACLTDIVMGDNVAEIGTSAFSMCESLTNVIIPNSVMTIGDAAFSGCDKLESFKGKYADDNGRVLIKDNKLIAYANASGTSYTIPNYVTSIGECAFYYCCNLVSVTIPENVIIIEYSAFQDCTYLENVTINGSGLTSIGISAFNYCDLLKNIAIPNSVTEIGSYAFNYCISLTNISIPNNVTKISECAFRDCRSLESITMPKSVTTIENQAFHGCKSLTNVTIPESVTTIGKEAFYNCTSLTEAYVRAATPPSLGRTAFTNCSDNLTIYVPIKSLNAYTSAYGWKNLNIEIIIKAVDLGLSVKWANCNLGANGPEEYGNYYAWGEINTKTDYTPDNSMSWNIPYASCPLNSEGNLILAWDAAYKTWGNSWRMPTKVELDELKNNCKWEWSTLNGVKGYTVTSKINGNSIFLPSNDSSVIDNKETGFGSYWSSTPCSDTTFDSEGRYAGAIGFYAKDYNISENVRIQSDYFLRWCKRGIRPVYNE